MSDERIVILPDPEACALAAAELIATTLVEAAAARDVAHWATTGGSTAGPTYRHLAQPPLRDVVPWEQVHLWWGDDRFVPADHPLSNVHVATSDLLEIGATSGESGTGASGSGRDGRADGRRADSRRERPSDAHRGGDRGGGEPGLGRAALRRRAGRGRRRVHRRRAGVRPRADRDGSRRPRPERLPGLGRVRRTRAGGRRARADARRAAPRPGHAPSAGPRGRAIGDRRRPWCRQGRHPRGGPRRASGTSGDWPAQLARRAGATWFLDEAAAARLRP